MDIVKEINLLSKEEKEELENKIKSYQTSNLELSKFSSFMWRLLLKKQTEIELLKIKLRKYE